jgi:hypothetical protein
VNWTLVLWVHSNSLKFFLSKVRINPGGFKVLKLAVGAVKVVHLKKMGTAI